VIRSARGEDVETLLAIHREAAITAFAHVFDQALYPFPTDRRRRDWSAVIADPAAEVYIAEVDGKPVGLAALNDQFLRNLHVLPSHWGTGVGSSLHDHAIERLRLRGCTHAKLWTLEANHNARRFYEKRGWTLNGETRVGAFPPAPLEVGYTNVLDVIAG
jgi:GNAT superfamily N-acetyltransferase